MCFYFHKKYCESENSGFSNNIHCYIICSTPSDCDFAILWYWEISSFSFVNQNAAMFLHLLIYLQIYFIDLTVALLHTYVCVEHWQQRRVRNYLSVVSCNLFLFSLAQTTCLLSCGRRRLYKKNFKSKSKFQLSSSWRGFC